MWTYLLILLSVFTILVVFLRRLFLFRRLSTIKQPKSTETEQAPPSEPNAPKLSKKEKTEVSALFAKGTSLLKAGKEKDAIQRFVKALAIDPDHLETQHALAMLYMKKDMFAAASALFERLAELTDDAVHFSHLGFSLYRQNDFEKAKKAYQKSISLDSKRPQRYVSLAQVYRSLKEFQNAVISLNKAVDLEPENVDYLFLLADLFLESGSATDAESTLHKIEKLDEKNEGIKPLMKEIRKLSDLS